MGLLPDLLDLRALLLHREGRVGAHAGHLALGVLLDRPALFDGTLRYAGYLPARWLLRHSRNRFLCSGWDPHNIPLGVRRNRHHETAGHHKAKQNPIRHDRDLRTRQNPHSKEKVSQKRSKNVRTSARALIKSEHDQWLQWKPGSQTNAQRRRGAGLRVSFWLGYYQCSLAAQISCTVPAVSVHMQRTQFWHNSSERIPATRPGRVAQLAEQLTLNLIR
jgi:hypothetical protein